MLEADERLIKWLLHQSGEPIAGIAKGTDMAWTTVSDLKKKETLLEKTSFENASKLTEYAKHLKGKIEMKKVYHDFDEMAEVSKVFYSVYPYNEKEGLQAGEDINLTADYDTAVELAESEKRDLRKDEIVVIDKVEHREDENITLETEDA